MNSKMIFLDEINYKYRKKINIKFKIFFICAIIYCILFLFYCVFCTIYIRAEVIGCSMQPTFNYNLVYGEDYESSIYKDIVYANRFQIGSNGSIVLVERPNDIVIKRIIAVAGQKITLKKGQDNLFHYYLSNDDSIGNLIDEYYVSEQNKLYMNYSYYLNFISSTGATESQECPNCEASVVVPIDKVFILGDNRKVSQDSHSYGFVDVKDIIGEVKIYYAYNENFFSYILEKIISIF